MWTKAEIQAWIEKYYTLENKPEMLYNLDSGYKLKFKDGQTYEYKWLRKEPYDGIDVHETWINGELVYRIKRNFAGSEIA